MRSFLRKSGIFVFLLITVMNLTNLVGRTFAQESPSQLYIPLIGITLVPDPLVLPDGPGKVNYNYAIKNFLQSESLTGITVTDDNCKQIKFVGGDDNNDSKLDYSETWRYQCSTTLSKSTQSTATATGTANDITAIHKAYAKVIVGSNNPAPLVSIVNISKIAYPLSLPEGGGNITYTYKVNNPGITPLSDVTVKDNKCNAMSGKLGDVNNNNILDTNEVWVFTCVVNLKETTTNTVSVTATSNGLKASDDATITVKVATPNGIDQISPNFPNTGEVKPDIRLIAWEILGGVLGVLILILVIVRNKKIVKSKKKSGRNGT